MAPLNGFFIVDFCQGPLAYCGRLLADLGATVVKVEPDGGEPGRTVRPAVQRDGKAPLSISFLFFNAGKRSVSLGSDWRTDIDALLSKADAVIEDLRPCDPRGFTRHLLERRGAQRRVWTHVQAYDDTGPCAGWRATDLTLLAHGGLLYLAGDPALPPLPAFGNQGQLSLAVFAALGTAAGLYRLLVSGEPTDVEVNGLECVAHSLENAVQYHDLEGFVRKRTGHRQEAATGVFRCANGYVYLFTCMGGTLFGWSELVGWMNEAGIAAATGLLDEKWWNANWRKTPEAAAEFEQIFERFSACRSREALFGEGQRRGVIIAPVSTPSGLLEDPGLTERGFFRKLPVEGVGNLAFPGAPYRMSGFPIGPMAAAPEIGEGNREFLGARTHADEARGG